MSNKSKIVLRLLSGLLIIIVAIINSKETFTIDDYQLIIILLLAALFCNILTWDYEGEDRQSSSN